MADSLTTEQRSERKRVRQRHASPETLGCVFHTIAEPFAPIADSFPNCSRTVGLPSAVQLRHPCGGVRDQWNSHG
jgi:hypothetical protein